MKTCSECNGNCCKSIVLPINNEIISESCKSLFIDCLYWIVIHDNISIGTNEGIFFNAIIKEKCSYLTEDGKCSDYENRPNVCKEFKVQDCSENKIYFGTVINNKEEFEKYFNKK